MGHEP